MKKIMIDMDDVICNKGFLKLVNIFLKTNYKEEDLKQYYIQDLIPVEKKMNGVNFSIIIIYMIMQNYYQIVMKLWKNYNKI